MADVAGYRDREHDPEGPSEMAGQWRCSRPSSLHRQTVRTFYLTQIHLTDLYWPESPPPRTSQRNPLVRLLQENGKSPGPEESQVKQIQARIIGNLRPVRPLAPASFFLFA